MNTRRKLKESKGITFKGKIYCSGEVIQEIKAKSINEFLSKIQALKCKCE